jgi:[protein-PII] uridylyltransferase
VDQAVTELFREARPPGAAMALVAIGGYGRGELCPASDVDLMVLHGERRADRVRAVAERVFYPLWDQGIALGHAVRTSKEAIAEAKAGVETATALLEARLLEGDPSVHADLMGRLHAWVGRDPAAFIARVSAADAERHARAGSAAHLMEPDVKEAAGGLRDVHSVGWAGRALGLESLEVMEEAGLLRRFERVALEDAEEFFVRLRSAMHLEAGKRADRVVLEHQPRLAQAFGFDATAGLDAADALMRTMFGHARHVEHVRALAFERLMARARKAPVSSEGAGWPGAADPQAVMEGFARWANGGAAPSAAALDALERAPFDPPERWTEGTLGAFVSILRSGNAGAHALETMDRIEVLQRFVPEWRDVRCRPQRDPYHTFTVDTHLLRTAAEAARLLDAGENDPVAREAASLADPEALLIGAFLHDAGKIGRGEHVPVGIEVAGAVLDRMGVSTATADTVRFLVGEHLLLADTATRRDLSDSELLREVAARVGDQERLASLYLLTLSDAHATGPHARTPWRLGLVRELVSRIERVLEHGEAVPDHAVAAARGPVLRAALDAADSAAVERFLARMPDRYLASVDPGVVAEHLRLAEPDPQTNEIRTAVGLGTGRGTYRLAVVARDRPGLLSLIAGALALSGLSILSAQAFTSDDGLALDLFEIEPAFHGDVDEERWRRFRSDLRHALEGQLSLNHRVEDKQRHYPPGGSDLETRVRLDNEASSEFTIVEVFAPDRIGLLFQVTDALRDLGLDVHLAKVATYGGRVVDAFYVRELDGRRVEDPPREEAIRLALEARLAIVT